MEDGEIEAELLDLDKKWDAFRAAFDEHGEGMAGSPGEWMVERMNELETEMKRRAAAAPKRKCRRKKEKMPFCRNCPHRGERHKRGRCEAYYSAGPSGTFRCGCPGYIPREAKKEN